MRRLLLAAAAFAAALPGLAFAQAPAAQPPLRCAVDGTFAPHAFPSLQGGVQGFQIDLFREVARRMGREIVIDSASFSGLIPAMNAGRYDFLCAPTTVTPERAASLLFTEGYLWTELQFGIRRGTPPIRSEEDLRGKTISVNKGTPYEQWVTRNAERLNLTLLAFDTQPDAVQAVIQGRAYANLSGNTVVRFSASRTPQYVADFVLPGTRLHWGTPFRQDSGALRNQVEDVLTCMKRDGTIARLSERWFGNAPGPDQAERIEFPGYGPPGLPGYDPTPQNPRCG
ncbi:transporter substrate-binding domain-containing protein [Sediminicoccus rosea]|jgi:polar amino acid transport system substrate-binding protein|uniref:Transporter substrate-binding domain-containing protein n=1 Tax=Sediminicoccus rosea TaxID=1225128 RepID=A0ABZ0PIZ5_9PROT|nr:transporter substrate-binding domain-containing protein [Sediminicoccus rosea]WPB85694.1 transporter substrate-binding domain-containing protein [Sediminicoccus rosea]